MRYDNYSGTEDIDLEEAVDELSSGLAEILIQSVYKQH